MPRPRKIQSSSTPQLTSGQATYIVEKLISERRLSPGEVNRYIGDMQREISDLERRLVALRAATGSAGMSAGSGAPRRRPGRPPRQAAAAGAEQETQPRPRRGAKAGRRARRPRAITGEQMASRQLQGRYLGLIRQIPATRRAQYKRIAAEKGREAAIKEMLGVLKK